LITRLCDYTLAFEAIVESKWNNTMGDKGYKEDLFNNIGCGSSSVLNTFDLQQIYSLECKITHILF
jgi:hypothetical protein